MKSAGSVLIRHPDGLRQSTRQPLSIRVEDRLRRAIQDGNLGPGTRLPSSRVLARDWFSSPGPPAPPPTNSLWTWLSIVVHMPLIGLPIALFTRDALRIRTS